jgi:ABC-type uncharacterized transport system substrate-binding protein
MPSRAPRAVGAALPRRPPAAGAGRFGPRRLRLIALVALLGLWGTALAAGQVVIIGDPERPTHQQVATAALRVLRARAPQAPASWLATDALDGSGPHPWQQALLAPVGVDAALAVLEHAPERPVLHALIPASTYAHVRERRAALGHGGPTGALVIDQPLERRLALVRAAFPEARRLAVLLGPASRGLAPGIRAAVGGRWELALEEVSATREVVPALEGLLRPGGVLLSFADPVVYNRETVKSILLTSFRYRVPVVGFSQSYVRAGAVAAVYSTPEQIGEQLGGLLADLLGAPSRHLEELVRPARWSLALNRRVARSLGLDLPREEALQAALRAAPAGSRAP